MIIVIIIISITIIMITCYCRRLLPRKPQREHLTGSCVVHTCICVCIYIYIYIHVYVCIYIYIYVWSLPRACSLLRTPAPIRCTSDIRKTESIHHRHRPEGVVYRSFCLNSGTVAVSEFTSRRWWCIESLLPDISCRRAPRLVRLHTSHVSMSKRNGRCS